jgi:UDP-N-acetylglucosamine 2-epimerase (non-hydrolysing)
VQRAEVMTRFEPVLLNFKPDWVFVPGDVNSTIACALVASKLGAKVAHVEAGLRSFDRSMPEEINRVLTDHLADLLFTTEPSANENLRREGIAEEKVHFVGNTMIDTLVRLLPKAQSRWSGLQERLEVENYVLVTLHRPSNVDEPKKLREIVMTLLAISREIPVIFPVHPRTRQRVADLDLPNSDFLKGIHHSKIGSLRLIEPLGYLDFLALQAHAKLVLTDSGGIQEETTYLDVPCLTARPNTERPVTLQVGTNKLVSSSLSEQLVPEILQFLSFKQLRKRQIPEFWDGVAAKRILNVLKEYE